MTFQFRMGSSNCQSNNAFKLMTADKESSAGAQAKVAKKNATSPKIGCLDGAGFICAEGYRKNVCHGGSGGPLVLNDRLAGIVLEGDSCDGLHLSMYIQVTAY
ncbi:hypothetical protein QAD02_022721 [Eretmocerus hayati]|uniref:Uncharacterized protein n=1 Tax=Eretmocerus hayati TaxID=131215 RepID=A0ACC2PU55_9HYME|nr:hypothetical protein QAD02_022721 [Eretmocerus hayati]